MKFADSRRAGWDTETTSPIPTEARIVTAAIVVRGANRPPAVMSWVINPGVPIPAEAAEIHGYDDARVQAEGQDPATALDEIAVRLTDAIGWGMPLVAFNHSFDWSVLHYDLQRHGLPTVQDRVGPDVPLPLIDPHVIDKQMDRYVKGSGMRKLQPTAERYGIEITDWHTADADAEAALRIAEAQFARFPQLDRWSPAALFAAQQSWRAEQQAGLERWFRTKATAEQGGDPNKVIAREWPLLPPQAEAVDA